MNNKNNSESTFIMKIKKNKHNILAVIMLIAIIITVTIYKKYLNVKTTYTVINGYVEKSTDTLGTILKDETVVELSKSEATIPIIEQNKRIAKGDIIAMYKNSEYDEYLSSIAELDKVIQTLIVDLPTSYSNDVASIDSQITTLAKQAKEETSYIKMQEYKSKIDELSYKKVIILGERSPEGSKVRELIEQRKEIEKNSKFVDGNSIIAPVSGVATYKIDGLENLVNIDNILNYDVTKLEDIISKYKSNNINNYGVKIVDNYNAYILVKEQKGENDKYIELNKKYNLKFGEKNIDTITAKLVKCLEGKDCNYVIFQVENGIENLVDLRTVNTEVVWKKVFGMAIPKTAVKTNEEKNYKYVTLVYGTQYIDVPIKIVIESDNICIVDNLSKEEKSNLGITSSFILELYDKLVIE